MSSAKFDSNSTSDEVANAFSGRIKGKVVLITGVSPGSLGCEVVRVIVQHQPKLVILAGRSTQKLNQIRDHILEETPPASLRTLYLDLASLDQVRAAADEVNSYKENIDVLINSAGIMAAPYSQTTDGFENQFGTNHLGPFLFTNLIVPKLLAAPHGARIVVVSSDGHAFSPIKFDNPNWSVSHYAFIRFHHTDRSSIEWEIVQPVAGIWPGKDSQCVVREGFGRETSAQRYPSLQSSSGRYQHQHWGPLGRCRLW